MLKSDAQADRALKSIDIESDLVIIGGGMAGSCCAITAARQGLRVVLVQDRPVLGGNGSSEVRLWILGATSHMGNNNRWAREGGVINEILVENMFRNGAGNPVIFDTIVLEKVVAEPNITLLLNTAAFEVTKSAPDRIAAVRAFCSQNSTMYELSAPLFCDASGDGVIGFLSGAAFRMGAESRDEFGEKFAPSADYGELLGHSLYFYTKDVGRPTRFVPPSYALRDIAKIPRYRSFNAKDHGCHLWWIEYGGRLDTVHDTETIKWELWKVVYGVWDYIKNSGEFPEALNRTLEWVGHIPGKRESRRFEGPTMLVQQDVVEQRPHDDAVSFGGWAIDLHPADGIFSEKPGCNQWHAKGIYPIPYRTMFSRNVNNLFLTGRLISASHVAFGSTRVMATCAHNGQAVAMAAAICHEQRLDPPDVAKTAPLGELQQRLLSTGQYIPGVALADPNDLARQAMLTVSSELQLAELVDNGPLLPLDNAWAMMVPLAAGPAPRITLVVDVDHPAELVVELRICSRLGSYTPDMTLATQTTDLAAGKNQSVSIQFDAHIRTPQYAFYCVKANPQVSVHTSEQRATGVLSVTSGHEKKVASSGKQSPSADIGVDTFELWRPVRRPGGRNLAIRVEPPLEAFAATSLTNGIARPTTAPNAWVADWQDASPCVTLQWPEPQRVGRIELSFDTDFDHPMESVLMGHPEDVMPFCVRNYRVYDDQEKLLHEQQGNYQTRNTVRLLPAAETCSLRIAVDAPHDGVPAALMEVRCYAD
ncbi:MAG: FAD-dependent oxidoreductase [Pirellulales bacterium]|nr:FAD-dependent oxidoreductase [Pirellulales bacterium]